MKRFDKPILTGLIVHVWLMWMRRTDDVTVRWYLYGSYYNTIGIDWFAFCRYQLWRVYCCGWHTHRVSLSVCYCIVNWIFVHFCSTVTLYVTYKSFKFQPTLKSTSSTYQTAIHNHITLENVLCIYIRCIIYTSFPC